MLGRKKCDNEQLEELRCIMECISDNTFSSPDFSLNSRGIRGICGENIMSSTNTIRAVDYCSMMGFFSDAFTLIRKYRDDLFQYLYLVYVIQSSWNAYENELNNCSVDDENVIHDLWEKYISGENKTSEQKATEAWLFGDIVKNEYMKARRDFFDTSKYKNNLMQSNDKIRDMMNSYLQQAWKDIDRILNNYVHGNGRRFILDNYAINDKQAYMADQIVKITQDITTMFLCVLAMLDAGKLRSSDYLDALELGHVVNEESLHWVMPCVQSYMGRYCSRLHSDLLQYVNDNNSHEMTFVEK